MLFFLIILDFCLDDMKPVKCGCKDQGGWNEETIHNHVIRIVNDCTGTSGNSNYDSLKVSNLT